MVEIVSIQDEVLDTTDDENRMFMRFPSRFPARFKDTRNDFGRNVYLRNASGSGVKIVTKEPLYLNDYVTLEVEVPDGKNPVIVKGEVVWTRDKDSGMWDVGLRLHKVDLLNMSRLYRYV